MEPVQDGEGGIRVLAINVSPEPTGRTQTAALEMLAGAESQGAVTQLVGYNGTDALEPVFEALEQSDAVIFAAPTYRARPAAQLKQLLDALPRPMPGPGVRQPFAGKAVALIQTGASAHHFLGAEDTRGILSAFFAAQVMAPSLYFCHADFESSTTLTESSATLARHHGRALAQWAQALRACPEVQGLQPLA